MMMNWTTTDGKSWSITIGDKTASVRLWMDDTTYGSCVWQINSYSTTLTNLEPCDCIKKAKKACLDEIERINVACLKGIGEDNERAQSLPKQPKMPCTV
jgi:hypothetical protein